MEDSITELINIYYVPFPEGMILRFQDMLGKIKELSEKQGMFLLFFF